MRVPKVVIVGRPNVGKSSIFNWLAGRRLAVVDDMAGVTRDRQSYLMHEDDRYFELVDTGGMGIRDVDNLTDQIEEQITAGIDEADMLLFVVDTKSGLLPLDEEVSRRLRYVNKPIICIANKTDGPSLDAQADEFYKLGRGKLVRTSVRANYNRDELLELIIDRLPEAADDEADAGEEPEMKIAIVGRRNVGKSTFVNTLVNAERMIVSEVAGTTRDSVDVRFELDGKAFVGIDTPGLRKSKSVRTDVDFYGTRRAQRSIRRADVVLLFFDSSSRISKVDKQLCGYITEHYKPCVFVVNKWDLMHAHMPTDRWVRYLRDNFKSMWHVPIAFITGDAGKNVKALLNHAQMLFKQARDRVPTSKLNKLLRQAVEHHAPAMSSGRRPKIYYGSQVGTEPPTIILMVNEPKAFTSEYRRYLIGVFRDQLSFGEVPIRLFLKRRSRDDYRDEVERENGGSGKKADAEVSGE